MKALRVTRTEMEVQAERMHNDAEETVFLLGGRGKSKSLLTGSSELVGNDEE